MIENNKGGGGILKCTVGKYSVKRKVERRTGSEVFLVQ